MGIQAGSLSLRRYGNSHGSHVHGYFQVLLGLDGVLELEVQGRGRRIAAGDGCVIAPGDRHDFESTGGSRCLVLDTPDAAWTACTGRPAQARHLPALARYLDHALQDGNPMAAQLGPMLLLDAWREPPAGTAGTYRATGQGLERVIDWIALAAWAQSRLHEPLSVADMAAQASLSPSQFSARCRRETGQSAMQWLRVLRLERALVLRGRGRSVAETAQRCGYRSASALTAAMRRQEIRS